MTSASARVPTRRRRLLAAAVVVVVVGLTLIATSTVPIPHSFATGFALPHVHLGVADLPGPEGATISATWSATGGGTADVLVADGSDYPIYASNGTEGSFSFPATSPPYTFQAITASNLTEQVTISGTYTSPLL
jgi:hypothetical protein